MINRMRSRVALFTIAAALIAVCVPRLVTAAIIYEQTITPLFVATTSTNGNSNCRASQGCMGKTIGEDNGFAFVVDDINNATPDGLLPNVLIFNFTLTAAEQAAIKGTPGIGQLIVTAARDIGRRAKEGGGHDDPTEWLDARFNDVMIGVGDELFRNVLSTCPFQHSEASADLTCGPNFNTDLKSTAMVSISGAMFNSAADHSDIEVELDPTNAVARLKIASVTLRFVSVPEPPVWTLMIAALLAAGFLRGRSALGRRG